MARRICERKKNRIKARQRPESSLHFTRCVESCGLTIIHSFSPHKWLTFFSQPALLWAAPFARRNWTQNEVKDMRCLLHDYENERSANQCNGEMQAVGYMIIWFKFENIKAFRCCWDLSYLIWRQSPCFFLNVVFSFLKSGCAP